MKSRLVEHYACWLIPVGVGVVCVLLGFGDDLVREQARYERSALAAGELWRLLTAHLVHLNTSHLAMNMVALGILVLLLDDCLDAAEWAVVMLAAALGIDAGLYWLAVSVQWYVGLSGILHGVLVAGALNLVARADKVGFLLLVFALAKLAWEQWVGPMPFSETGTGGTVVVAAHLYGAIAGALALVLLKGVRRLIAARL